jgi:arylsulfatase A-like enzyme
MYVTPFDRMNAVLKLLETDRYRRLMSMDTIVTNLMPSPPVADELDHGVQVMNYRFCTTLDEIESKLKAGAESRPVFAYSLPQDLHISHVRSRPIPAGRSYAGLFPPVAASVEEIDGCFGRFIEFLKERGLYNDSVVVLTSDHGDSLGEARRFGHSYTIFPEVMKIPLIIHVPPRLRATFTADPDAIAFSTDLAPTFYALAGHHPQDLGPFYGRPLFSRHEGGRSRADAPQLITSSYGAVYGVLQNNGTRLFIADGVNSRDYAYELDGNASTRVGVTAEERATSRRFIRAKLDELAVMYQFQP